MLEVTHNLASLNLKNGNNKILGTVKITGNPLLTCIQVDDVAYAEANWTKDAGATFSEDCSAL